MTHPARRLLPRGSTRRFAPFALLAAFALLASCRPEEHPLGIEFTDLEGDWRYQATQVRAGAVSCTISGLTLSIVQVNGGGGFSGSATPGEMKCSDPVGSYTIPLQPYPVINGYTFNEYFSFDLYNSGWRHGGVIASPDSLDGTFTLISGSAEFRGEFTAVRQRR